MFTSAAPFMTIGLLILSNVFMTFAWYGHLKFEDKPLYLVVLVSWGIAFFEYCAQVPANRIGYGYFNAAQLKTIQEIITLSVFVIFSVFYLGESIQWKQIVGFGFIALGAFFIFTK
ncbi:DMT family protein [Rhizobium terrae]|uniref:DMT family protein n=1 Tax=Rhizobium terrae TaxID=2171756 RepID=UPI000E3CF82E|nr:DMT family protein [Rhizobium terrae]